MVHHSHEMGSRQRGSLDGKRQTDVPSQRMNVESQALLLYRTPGAVVKQLEGKDDSSWILPWHTEELLAGTARSRSFPV